MIRKKKELFFLFLLMVLASASLAISSTPAYATSIYDDAYRTVDHISIGMYHASSGKSCPAVNYDTTWRSVFDDPAQWASFADFATYHDELDEALAAGGFVSIAQYADYHANATDYSSAIVIQYSEDEVEFPWHPEEIRRAAEYGVTTVMINARNTLYLNGYCDPVVQVVDEWNNYPVSTYRQLDDSNTNTFGLSPGESSFNVWNIQGVDPNYPSGYAGEMVAEASLTPLHPEYIALGDSFSSGEGVEPFFTSTWTSTNKCHRSPYAWPYKIALEQGVSVSHKACSGATSKEVINGKYGEDPQVETIDDSTKVVTVTTGGNDMGFKDYATACVGVFTDCDELSPAYADSWAVLTDPLDSDYLPDSLEDLFDEISTNLTSLNTTAKVFVVGYPHIIDADAFSVSTYQQEKCDYLSGDDAEAIEKLINKLNQTIEDAVDTHADGRFEFIDPNNPIYSAFSGHGVCTIDPYFNDISYGDAFGGDNAYVFHPNAYGQQAYAESIYPQMFP